MKIRAAVALEGKRTEVRTVGGEGQPDAIHCSVDPRR